MISADDGEENREVHPGEKEILSGIQYGGFQSGGGQTQDYCSGFAPEDFSGSGSADDPFRGQKAGKHRCVSPKVFTGRKIGNRAAPFRQQDGTRLYAPGKQTADTCTSGKRPGTAHLAGPPLIAGTTCKAQRGRLSVDSRLADNMAIHSIHSLCECLPVRV